jgi:hypothetical protein
MEVIRRIWQQSRGEARQPPPPPDDDDEQMLKVMAQEEAPKHFEDYRLWLYRLCILLPNDCFFRFISIEAEPVGDCDNLASAVRYSDELAAMARICNRYGVMDPTTNQHPRWDAETLARRFQEMLFIRGRVLCFKETFCAMAIRRDPASRRVQTITLEPTLGHPIGKRRYRHR